MPLEWKHTCEEVDWDDMAIFENEQQQLERGYLSENQAARVPEGSLCVLEGENIYSLAGG